MELESLGDLSIHIMLSKLGPENAARVACLNNRFKALASEDTLWSRFCSQELNLSAPVDHLGQSLPSFKVAYQRWRDAFRMYPWPLVKRAKRCWDRLEDWLMRNFPEAGATLRKGASETDLEELEKVLKVKLPIPTRILYRLHDGQEFLDKDLSKPKLVCSLGLIGGYSFYDHVVNVYLLPLSQVILETSHIIRHLGFTRRSKYIVLAASCATGEKIFFLNCNDGQLYVGTRNLPTEGEMMPCVPSSLVSSVHDFSSDQQQDAVLLWLEEHAHRLQSGMIKLREDGSMKSICQFPEEPSPCSLAITNGVQVRASSVFVPEFSDLHHDAEKYLFCYSIRMSLMPEGCVINGLYFNSCQLHWRHWIIRANDVVVSDVNAEAVIGKFPLLHPGGEEFVYQSCSFLPSSKGSIEGAFTFVPGRLAEPKGSPFNAQVAQFPLQLPDYIF